MPSYDLGEYLSDDSLSLENVVTEAHPKGKTYKMKSPSAAMVLQLKHVMRLWDARETDSAPTKNDIAELIALTTDDEGAPVDLEVKLMGALHQRLVDDGISADRLALLVSLITVHYGRGEAVAKMMVDQAGEAKARPNRATRRATKRTPPKKAGSRSSRASTVTPARTPSRTSTRSSKTPDPEVQAEAG